MSGTVLELEIKVGGRPVAVLEEPGSPLPCQEAILAPLLPLPIVAPSALEAGVLP